MPLMLDQKPTLEYAEQPKRKSIPVKRGTLIGLFASFPVAIGVVVAVNLSGVRQNVKDAIGMSAFLLPPICALIGGLLAWFVR